MDFEAKEISPGKFDVVAAAHPLRMERHKFELPEGCTIQEIVERVSPNKRDFEDVVVMIGDRFVPEKHWKHIRPKRGSNVIVRVLPQGGGGGRKNPLLVVFAVIAAFVLPPLLGPTATFGTVTAAGTNIVTSTVGGTLLGFAGRMLVGALAALAFRALVGPPEQQSLSNSVGTVEVSPSLSGAGNAFRPYDVIPKVLGKVRFRPPLGASIFTEIVGDDQYLRMLLVWGRGPLEIDETSFKIGSTLLSSFSDVEVETIRGDEVDQNLTLFSETVFEEQPNVVLNVLNDSGTRTSQPDIDEVSIDITFPQGLFHVDNNGGINTARVDIRVEWSPVAAGTWTELTNMTITSNQQSTLRKGFRFIMPTGQTQIDVRVTRSGEDSGAGFAQTIDGCTWTAFRSITADNPIKETGLAKTALRIRATDQLNGNIETFSGEVQSIVPDWNGSSWVLAATSNPASLAREVLQGSGNSDPLDDESLILTDFESWHDRNVTEGLEFNQVIDFQSNVYETFRSVCSAGRASPNQIDGKWTVIIDEAKTAITQHFSPRNTSGFKGQIGIPNLPHAFRVRFPNRDKDWEIDERVVFDDGFDDTNATKFETLDLPGVTDPDKIWLDARYFIAVARLRREVFIFNTDVEYLVATRGDLVRFTHDVPQIGIATGRVQRLIDDGTNVTDIVVDEDSIVMESGKSYNVRFRKDDGSTLLKDVTTDTAPQKEFIRDSTASRRDGIIDGSVSITDGQIGNALLFPGNTESVEVDDPNDVFSFAGTASFSVEFWARATVYDNLFPRIVDKQFTDGGGDQGWRIIGSQSGETIGFSRMLNSGAESVSVALPEGEIAHLAFTYDGSTLRVYKNGVFVTSAASTASIVASAEPMLIGNLTVGGTSRPWHGWLDDLRVWSDQRLESEIAANYQKPLRGDEDNLVWYGKFNQIFKETRLTFTTPEVIATAPKVGDLFQFGEQGTETTDLVIKDIEPQGDLTARITCLEQRNEIFDAGILPQNFAPADVNTGDETINAWVTNSDNPFYNNDEIQFSTTGTLPAGLATLTTYYVIERTAVSIKVSTTEGGTPVDMTDQGTGTHTITRQIPAFVSNITILPGFQLPVIDSVQSDETVLVREPDGSLSSRMVVNYIRPQGDGGRIVGIEGEYRHSTDEIRDATSNGDDGTFSANNKLTYVPGKFQDGLHFRGNNTDDWISLPNGILNGATDFTVEFWLKTKSTAALTVVSAANATLDNEFIIYLPSADTVQIITKNTSTLNFLSVPIYRDGVWHHFSVVRASATGNVELFIDGVSQGVQVGNTGALTVDAGGLIIGQEQDSVGGGFAAAQSLVGDLDDLRFFTIVRSQVTIAAEKDIEIPSDTTGLRAYYKVDDPGSFVRVPFTDVSAGFVEFKPVEDLEPYEFRLRNVFEDQSRGEWTATEKHVVIGKSSPPSDVTGFTAVTRAFDIYLSWDEIDDLDRKDFEVRRGASWETGTVLDRTDALFLTDIPRVAGVYTYWVKAFDTSNNESLNAATYVLTIVVPAAPGNLTDTFEKAEVVLSWLEPTADFEIKEYEVRRGGTGWGDATFIGVSDTRKFNIPAEIASDDTWRVAAIDIAGNVGTNSDVVVSIVLPNVSNISAQVIDNSILFRFTGTPGSLPIDKFEVRRGATFSSATVIGTADATFVVVDEQSSGTFTYWIAAIDTAGNFGTEVSKVVSVDEPPDFVFRNQFDTDWIGNSRTNIRAETQRDINTNTLNQPGIPTFDASRTCLFFDGVDDVVTVLDDATIDFGTGDFTAEAWVKITESGISGGVIFAKKSINTGATAGWVFFVTSSDGLRAVIADGTDVIDINTDATETLELNQWYHVALVVTHPASVATAEIFINGVSRASGNNSLVGSTDNNLNLVMGSNNSQHFEGFMDEWRVWDDARTSTELQNNDDIELIGDEANLVCYLRANVSETPLGETTTIPDLSANGNDGSISGALWSAPEPIALAPVDTTQTWANHFTTNSWTDSAGKAASSFPIHVQPTPTSATFVAYFDVGIVVASSRILADINADILDGNPTIVAAIAVRDTQVASWTAVGNDDVFTTNFRYIRITVTVTATTGDDLFKLNDLTVTVRSKIRNDSGQVSVTSSAGATVNFNVSFLDVEGITATPNVSGGAARYAVIDFTDAPNPTSFTVYVFDNNGSFPGTTEVRWSARGF